MGFPEFVVFDLFLLVQGGIDQRLLDRLLFDQDFAYGLSLLFGGRCRLLLGEPGFQFLLGEDAAFDQQLAQKAVVFR